jgi:hypothetical protein
MCYSYINAVLFGLRSGDMPTACRASHICPLNCIKRSGLTKEERHPSSIAARNHAGKKKRDLPLRSKLWRGKGGLGADIPLSLAQPSVAIIESQLRAAERRRYKGQAMLRRHGNRGGAPWRAGKLWIPPDHCAWWMPFLLWPIMYVWCSLESRYETHFAAWHAVTRSPDDSN